MGGERIFDGIILDVDGVIWIAGAPAKGAILFLESLRRANVAYCFLTNDCSVAKSERWRLLADAGVSVEPQRLITAAEVTRVCLSKRGATSIMYLGAPAALEDVASGIRVCDRGPVDAVVVGDLFGHYDRSVIDRAAEAVREGASLVAMQRNQSWSDGSTWRVDNGFWVAGLEYVTGQRALVAGKPGRLSYEVAMSRLGVLAGHPESTAFVSDDVLADLRGAKEVGLTTVAFGAGAVSAPWVDLAAPDMEALAEILLNRRHA